ncbi:Thiamine-monophosphate kinase [Clostridiaceae bacterium JG1575]|nr:Thiamine-monophosphate kinase [Clostridiaceae bacterium JG1575]
METGKLNTQDLKTLLSNYTGAPRQEVLLAGRLGEDCSFIRLGETVLTVTTDPVTAASTHQGTLAFHINMNDLATSGAEGLGVMVTLLLPPRTEKKVLEDIMGELHRLCVAHNIQILGGHTEVTDAVNRPLLSLTALGIVPAGEEIYTGGAKAGDALVVSKMLAIEGTLILLEEAKATAQAIFSPEDWAQLEGFSELLSVIPEGEVGKELSVHAMHDVTEGGIQGAVYELAQGSGLGCVIERRALPFAPASLKLIRALGLEESRTISSGAMLFATEDPQALLEALAARGIAGTIIGHLTAPTDCLMQEPSGERHPMAPPAKDEIYRLFEEARS